MEYNDFEIKGIDVSVFNGVIDWTKVIGDFASIRVGYGRTLDSRFNINYANCKLDRFGYWYLDYYNNHISTHPAYKMSNDDWGTEQAENCYKFMGNKDYVYLDIESTNGSYAPKITEVRTRVLEIAKAFLIRYDQLNGKTNGIYCSLGLLDWFDDWFKTRPLWVAWYNENQTKESVLSACENAGWNNCLIWQWSSEKIIPGIGQCDTNGWIGTNAQYQSMFGTIIPDDEAEVIPVNYTQKIVNVGSLSYLNIRQEPSTNSKVLGRYFRDTVVNIESIKDGWAKLYGQPGYVYDQYLK